MRNPARLPSKANREPLEEEVYYMADTDLQIEEKQEVQATGESTRNVPVFVPAVDIYESENALTLVADMPGIPIESVDIDLDSDQLTMRGTIAMQDEKGKV